MATKTTGSHFVNLSGVDEALSTLEQYPNKINSVVKKALKASVNPTIESMKSYAHPKFRKIVKYKLMRGRNPLIKFGFFGKKGEFPNGKNVPTWFKAYWKNYGTLDYRFSGHSFERKRKALTAKWTGGVKPVLFFERSVAGHEEEIFNRFKESILQEVEKIENGK